MWVWRKVISDDAGDDRKPCQSQSFKSIPTKVATLKVDARRRLTAAIEAKCAELRELKSRQEEEMEPVSSRVDSLQEQLDQAMKRRMAMITRHVREVRDREEDIGRVRRKLENLDRHNAGACGGLGPAGSHPELPGSRPAGLEKDFECSVCLEEMRPPARIFQCRNGHVMCGDCAEHPEAATRCPSCRVPLRAAGPAAGAPPGSSGLVRNFPMEKLAASYYERLLPAAASASASASGSPATSRPQSRTGAAAAASAASSAAATTARRMKAERRRRDSDSNVQHSIQAQQAQARPEDEEEEDDGGEGGGDMEWAKL